MRRIIIIVSLFLRVFTGYGQDPPADSLLHYEYAYFNSTNDTLRQQFLLHKLDLHLRSGNMGPDAFHEVTRIRVDATGPCKYPFLWNAALLAYLNHEEDRASFYLAQYRTGTGDTTLPCLLLSVLISKYTDTIAFSRDLIALGRHDTAFRQLDCFLRSATYQRRHLKGYLLASALVPGLGTALNGFPVKGFISLALTAGSVYGIVTLVQYGLYVNAVLWGAGVGLKFYGGNLRLTEKSFNEREEQQKSRLYTGCESALKNLLINYPINLKALW